MKKVILTFWILFFICIYSVNAQEDNLIRYKINVFVHTTGDIALSANTGNYKFGYKIKRILKNHNGSTMSSTKYINTNKIVGWAAPGDDVWIHYRLTNAINNKTIKESKFHYSDFKRELNLYFVKELGYKLLDERNYKFWKNNR